MRVIPQELSGKYPLGLMHGKKSAYYVLGISIDGRILNLGNAYTYGQLKTVVEWRKSPLWRIKPLWIARRYNHKTYIMDIKE